MSADVERLRREVCALQAGDVRASEGTLLVDRPRERAGTGSTKGDRRHRSRPARCWCARCATASRLRPSTAPWIGAPLVVRPVPPGHRPGEPIGGPTAEVI